MKRLFIVALLVLILVPAGILIAQDTGGSDGDQPAVEIDEEQLADDVENVAEGVAEATVDVSTDLIDRLTTAPQTEVVAILMAIGGVALLFAGWRIYDLLIVLAGVLVGAMIGLAAVQTENAVVEIAAVLIGGVVGGFLSVFLFYVAIFFIGAYVGLALVAVAATMLNAGDPTAIASLLGAIIGGILLLMLSGELLIVFSAFLGAELVVLALGLDPVWTLVLAVVGVVVQLALANSFHVNLRRRPQPRRVFRRRAI